MTYNFKRAIGIALAMYVTSFIVGLIASAAAGVDMSSMSDIPDSFWYIGMVASVILVALFSLWYFSKAIKPSAKSGLLFGLTVVITSGILDAILFSLSPAEVDLSMYYGDFRYWITIALALLTAIFVGVAKAPKGSDMTPPPTTTAPTTPPPAV